MLLSCVPMAASADGDAYAVLGVQNGDRIILNPQIGGYTDFQHKVTIVDKDQSADLAQATTMDAAHFTLEPTATGIDFVEFAIDGTTVATVDKAPYEFVLGAEQAGPHTLTATINKAEGGTEVKTVAFTGIYGELSDYRLVDYNSGVLDASNTQTFNGLIDTGRTIEDGALKIGGNTAVTSAWLQPDVQTDLMELGDTKLFYVDYDVYRSHNDVSIAFRNSQGARGSISAQSGTIRNAMPVGEWVHVTVVADYERGWFSAYMNGVQFKSWAQTGMNNTDKVTDNLAPYLTGGNDRYICVDNYAVRTYETAQERSYSLVEVKDDVPMNLTTVPVVSKTVGINDTRGVSKVEYFVDGELAATVNRLPFTYDVPITKINSDFTVSAKVYAQTVTECAPITFKAIYLKEIGNRFDETFEGKTGTFSNSNIPTAADRSGAYSYTYVDATTEGLGRTGTVVKYDRDESNTTADALKGGLLGTRAVGLSDADGPNAYVKFQLDFYLPADKTYTSADKIFISTVGTYQDAVVCDLSKMEKGKWHHLDAYIDAPNREVIGNVGDNTIITPFAKVGENGATTGMTFTNTSSALIMIYVKSLSDLYVDNVFVDRVGVNDAVSGAFLNGISYDKDYEGVDATVSYCNMTNDPVNVNVYFGLYNGNTLVKGWAEPVTVAANEFKLISKDVAFAQVNGIGTSVRAFCWTPDLQPINVQRECN